MSAPIRVAIMGGGCAAMAAAWELSAPRHRGKYQLDVYQPGWRLGGKGASGRGPNDRIEEHGLHVWMGFYENAFRMMREAYTELERDPAQCHIATWRDAFFPAPRVSVADDPDGADWDFWDVMFPPLPGEPGDGPEDSSPMSIWQRVGRAIDGATRALTHALGLPGEPAVADLSPDQLWADVRWWLARAATDASGEALVGLGRVTADLARALARGGPEAMGLPRPALVTALDGLRTAELSALDAAGMENTAVVAAVDLALTMARAIVAEGLDQAPEGFDAIDDIDFGAWLQRNGARPRTLASGMIRSFYSLAFAFLAGDPNLPRSSAGPAARLVLRLFAGYRGSVFYKMQAGMGDIVFAPLYEAMVRRGVRFHFFHRLEDVGLSADGTHVARLTLTRQAEPVADRYEPLVEVRGVPCWPSEPVWARLRDGAELARKGLEFESPWETRGGVPLQLTVGRDFDLVVLGMGIGAVAHTCREILARDARWRTMVEKVETVATQAMQLWLRPSTRAMGWAAGPTTLTAMSPPFDTWADMSHLIPEESWPEGAPPGAVAYFCNVLPDAVVAPHGPSDWTPYARVDDTAVRAAVERKAAAWIDDELPKLWPAAKGPDGRFDWALLHGPRRPRGDLAAQYVRANVWPSDRYTLNLPGTAQHRISPLDRTYDNLTICGDWTSCGLDFGCVEAAVVSGLLAAHAIAGSPSLESIVGYDSP
jgi:uncharacterized protein with NAD-binding domain and iron-sulfur cluster